jgi:glycerol kinase
VEAMMKDSAMKFGFLRVDGGMVRNDLLMQFQADILDLPVVCPQVSETTALGAAYAAGLAAGFFKDTEELAANWKEQKRWQPKMSEPDREHLYRYWKKTVARSFDWLDY